MALNISNNEVIVNLNRKIMFYSLSDQKVQKTFEISPETLATSDLCPVGPEASENPIPPMTNELINKIQDVRVSPNGRHLVATTTGRKLLLLYEILPGSLNLLSARRISRASSAVTFSSDSSKIFMCDKTGDCYEFDCVEHNSPGKWIFGHLSMVLDIQFTPQQDLILTSDRDEKVRATNYPATHDIECYCLGHTEYVSSINLLPTDPNNVVVSLSGDKTIKLWNCRTGEKIHEISIIAPGIKSVVRKIDESNSHLGVLAFDSDKSVLVYKLHQKDSSVESSLISSHSFSSEDILDLGFSGDHLLVTLLVDGKLKIESIRYTGDKYESVDLKPLESAVETVFTDEKVTEFRDVSGWFKKKYDNVSEYLERKKRRIDEKLNKNSAVKCS